jgi:hypothetical protein
VAGAGYRIAHRADAAANDGRPLTSGGAEAEVAFGRLSDGARVCHRDGFGFPIGVGGAEKVELRRRAVRGADGGSGAALREAAGGFEEEAGAAVAAVWLDQRTQRPAERAGRLIGGCCGWRSMQTSHRLRICIPHLPGDFYTAQSGLPGCEFLNFVRVMKAAVILYAAVTLISHAAGPSPVARDERVSTDGRGRVVCHALPVEEKFRNAWPAEWEEQFVERVNASLRASDIQPGKYGGTFFENEKSSYPQAFIGFLKGQRGEAVKFLQQEDDAAWSKKLTLGVDWFPSFTIRS